MNHAQLMRASAQQKVTCRGILIDPADSFSSDVNWTVYTCEQCLATVFTVKSEPHNWNHHGQPNDERRAKQDTLRKIRTMPDGREIETLSRLMETALAAAAGHRSYKNRLCLDDSWTGDGPLGYYELGDLVIYRESEAKWAIDKIIVIPGCRTLPNGDPGYPDDMDSSTVASGLTVNEAILRAVAMAVTSHIERAWENDAIDRQFSEEPYAGELMGSPGGDPGLME